MCLRRARARRHTTAHTQPHTDVLARTRAHLDFDTRARARAHPRMYAIYKHRALIRFLARTCGRRQRLTGVPCVLRVLRVCVRACVRACVNASMRACFVLVHVHVCSDGRLELVEAHAGGLRHESGHEGHAQGAHGSEERVHAAHADCGYRWQEALAEREVEHPVRQHGRRARLGAHRLGIHLRHEQRGHRPRAQRERHDVRERTKERHTAAHGRGERARACRHRRRHERHRRAHARERAHEERPAPQPLDDRHGGQRAEHVEQPHRRRRCGFRGDAG
mmetsp:Transcript_11080/g.46042  ORF Transcript_11080/g.46042 Transcript_11080/m.46042 type:complete len:278 (-) Transcript_11080:186-1019(-)